MICIHFPHFLLNGWANKVQLCLIRQNSLSLVLISSSDSKMSSLSSSCKTALASSSVREHASDSVELILTPSGFVTQDQGQMLTSDLGLIEMTEAEYSDFQNFICGRAATQAGPAEGPDSRPHSTVVIGNDPDNSTAVSPLTSTQAIDLSVSSDDHCLLTSVEKTPVSYGEVPGFVLARINTEDSPATPLGKLKRSSQKQFSSSARVCLEKRFNSMCPETARQPDIHPTLLNRYFQKQRKKKTSFGSALFNVYPHFLCAALVC